MKKFLIIALFAMAGIAAASDSKTDGEIVIAFTDAKALLSGSSNSAPPSRATIVISATDFSTERDSIMLVCAVIPEHKWLINFGKATNTAERFGISLENIKHVSIIGDRLTEIKREFFKGCTELESVRLPKGIKTIRGQCLMDCPKVKIYAEKDSTTHGSLKAKGFTVTATATAPEEATSKPRRVVAAAAPVVAYPADNSWAEVAAALAPVAAAAPGSINNPEELMYAQIDSGTIFRDGKFVKE